MFSETMATVLRCHVLGDDGYGFALLEVGPGEIAAGDQPGAHGLKEARRNELETAERRHPALGVDVVLGIEDVGTDVAVGRHRVSKGHGGDAGNFGDLAANLLLHTEGTLRFLHLTFGDIDRKSTR